MWDCSHPLEITNHRDFPRSRTTILSDTTKSHRTIPIISPAIYICGNQAIMCHTRVKNSAQDFYRPHRSCGKVMFLHLSVSYSVHGGVGLPLVPGVGLGSVCHTTPWQTPPPGQTPPLADPPAQCMLGYGQQAGGTHPTGMHSSYFASFH